MPRSSREYGCLVSSFTIGAWFVFVAGFEQETLVMGMWVIVHVVLCPEIALWNDTTLVRAATIIVNVKVINIHNVVQLSGAGVVPTETFINRRFLRPCCAFVAQLQVVTTLEEEAFHVILRRIADPVHGEVFACLHSLALMLTRYLVSDVIEEDIHHVVQSDWTGAIEKGAFWIVGFHRA